MDVQYGTWTDGPNKDVLWTSLGRAMAIGERDGGMPPFSFYGQLPDCQSHDFSLIYPEGEFSFKRVKMWGQSKISSYCFAFGVNQKNQEAGGVQDSLV